MVVCHTTPWGIISVIAVYVLIAFGDYTTVKFVIEFGDSSRWWALLRINYIDINNNVYQLPAFIILFPVYPADYTAKWRSVLVSQSLNKILYTCLHATKLILVAQLTTLGDAAVI